MATRRPKVPRASVLGTGPASHSAGRKPTSSGTSGHSTKADLDTSKRETEAQIIQGNFGDRPSSSPVGATKSTRIAGVSATKHSGHSEGSSHSDSAGNFTGTSKPIGTNKAGAPKAGADKTSGSKSGTSSSKGGNKSTEAATPVPARAFSGRLLALAVVMIAITVLLAPTVKIWWEQRSQISALEADIAAKKAQQNDLNSQVSRWEDPAFVRQQARDRINMVMPGETSYWVFGADPGSTETTPTTTSTTPTPTDLPWTEQLWQSIKRSATD
ncbi:FtsB family cell division protein [Pseudarthrobacter sp. J1763]|uniref:FtsB family cell division protein n=1 Tax=Pseudarthrobacter sp. J1763 TaxID=3420445 RepID=UPI003D26A7F0